MLLKSFRIQKFRSIQDTRWINLSPDNITALIGQNEAGKTTILHGLYAFKTKKNSQDDFRVADEELPEISCCFEYEENELSQIIDLNFLPPQVLEKIKQDNYKINITVKWGRDKVAAVSLENDVLINSFNPSTAIKSTAEPATEPATIYITAIDFVNKLHKSLPIFEIFEDYSSLLPNQIDVDNLLNKNSNIQGLKGALNFIQLSGLDLTTINSQGSRFIENKLDALNKRVTKEFRIFWRQKIGKSKKIGIEVKLKNHSETVTGKAGKPYLEFWITDGQEKLSPKQRSKGVQWFLSFYIQLIASQANAQSNFVILLIDEPGGSLHDRAQEDVLKVFEKIKDKIQVIYTTHDSHLIGLNTLYRILAVQRADEEDDNSATVVLTIHELSAASSDTLSPIYTLMGASFADQNAIQKKNNVILEEISAHYYMRAFFHLIGSQKKAYFIPATGNSNVKPLIYQFLGWGLEFCVVLDDDPSARTVYKDLKHELYLDSDDEIKKKIYKIKDCHGIEDIFQKDDYKKYLLHDNSANIETTNSQYMKDNSISKPITALKFMQQVLDGEIHLDQFTTLTQNKIRETVNRLFIQRGKPK